VPDDSEGIAGEMPAATHQTPEPTGFDEFYRRYFLPLVRRSSWKHGLDKEDARDVVQEAFMIALAKLDPERNTRAWLIQVVDHLSLNFQRKAFRRAKLVTSGRPPGPA
jgi:DNA-directed RNA polymerase specialized sigma24 family protein